MVALATFTRAITAPARGIDTNGLTELLVLPLGPLRAKAGQWALEQWSYPLIYMLASAIAVSVALLAGLPAARRATSIQPMVAMRSE